MKSINGRAVYSVSEINSLTRQTLEQMSFWVEGEISSFRGRNSHYRYVYFDLKDPATGYKVPCLLEPQSYSELAFELEDGVNVLALGHLTLWEKEAKLSMYLMRIEIFGEGQLLAQLEELKKNLQAKGFFEKKYKKPLPKYPTNIAVISSIVSDAWQDFKKHSITKFPVIKTAFYDVKVQGPSSVEQLIKSIKLADQKGFDAIVIIRGGGSLEDLASYNDERVAEAIFSALTPIVVGVGHERDVTIAQLVADVAASTPTDAAKIVTADFQTLDTTLSHLLFRLKRTSQKTFSEYFQGLDISYHKLAFQKEKFSQIPRHLAFLRQSTIIAQDRILTQNGKKLQICRSSLKSGWKLNFQNKNQSVESLFQKLTLLSPEKTLSRGYSITKDENGKIVKDSAALAIDSKVEVKFKKGAILSKVLEKHQ